MKNTVNAKINIPVHLPKGLHSKFKFIHDNIKAEGNKLAAFCRYGRMNGNQCLSKCVSVNVSSNIKNTLHRSQMAVE